MLSGAFNLMTSVNGMQAYMTYKLTDERLMEFCSLPTDQSHHLSADGNFQLPRGFSAVHKGDVLHSKEPSSERSVLTTPKGATGLRIELYSLNGGD